MSAGMDKDPTMVPIVGIECGQCGLLKISASDATFIEQPKGRSLSYAVTCPDCLTVISGHVPARSLYDVRRILKSIHVPIVQLTAREPATTDPLFTLDDVIDFHTQVDQLTEL